MQVHRESKAQALPARQRFTREPDAVTNVCGVWTGDLDGIA